MMTVGNPIGFAVRSTITGCPWPTAKRQRSSESCRGPRALRAPAQPAPFRFLLASPLDVVDVIGVACGDLLTMGLRSLPLSVKFSADAESFLGELFPARVLDVERGGRPECDVLRSGSRATGRMRALGLPPRLIRATQLSAASAADPASYGFLGHPHWNALSIVHPSQLRPRGRAFEPSAVSDQFRAGSGMKKTSAHRCRSMGAR